MSENMRIDPFAFVFGQDMSWPSAQNWALVIARVMIVHDQSVAAQSEQRERAGTNP